MTKAPTLNDYWPMRQMKMAQYKHNPKKLAFWRGVGSLLWWARQINHTITKADIVELVKSDFKSDAVIAELIIELAKGDSDATEK